MGEKRRKREEVCGLLLIDSSPGYLDLINIEGVTHFPRASLDLVQFRDTFSNFSRFTANTTSGYR